MTHISASNLVQVLIDNWVVVNYKKSSIWKKPFLNESEAQIELGNVLKKYPTEPWKIEHHKTWMLRRKSYIKTEEDKEFEDF